MNYLIALLAGIVQGLTEFLPVSSTGHLVIFEKIFHLDPDIFGLAFDASLHLGTLLAVLIFFAGDYLEIFKLKNKLALKLLIGTAPAAVAGLLLEGYIESTLREIWVVGAALIFFSAVFVVAEKIGKKSAGKDQTTVFQSFIIGVFQAIALIPGISRSGSTISAGLLLGLKRDEAAKFAFMLSGPIIAGAGAKKFLEVITNQGIGSDNFLYVLIGITSSALFGYLTIKYFLKYLAAKTLYPFIAYRVALGIVLLALSFFI
jgi:undecaprenyl-diphosphatase